MSTGIKRALSSVGLSDLPFQVNVMLTLSFLFSLGRNIAFPYLAIFLTASSTNGGLQFDPALVGFMIMIGGLGNTFALLATGSMCDRFGRRRMMMIFIIPQIILTAGYAYARTYVEFLLIHSTSGILAAFYDPAYSAMIADLVEPSRREEVYGLSYMIANIGTVIGPPIGGLAAIVTGYSSLFIYATVLTILGGILLVFLIKESYPKEEKRVSISQLAGIFRDRVFILFCFTGALTNVVYTQLYGLLSVYIEQIGVEPYLFGILFSVNGAMVVVLQIPIRRWAMNLGTTKAFIVAQFLYAAGFAYFMVAADFTQFLIGVVVLTLGEITFFPAASGFVANLAPADKRGRYMALLGLFLGIGGSTGSQMAFAIYGMLDNKGLIWGIIGAIGFATLPFYLLLLKVVEKRINTQPSFGSKEQD